MDVMYTAIAHATRDGRSGHVETEDGQLTFEMRIPKEMGGPGGGANPELLFAAGYSACFHSALRLVGRARKADVTDSAVSASVGIGQLPNGGFGLTVALDVHLPKVDHDAAEALVAAAHQVCPYSNATRNNIDVTLSVV
jgi:lipoyl-dependent peroxiredoxin